MSDNVDFTPWGLGRRHDSAGKMFEFICFFDIVCAFHSLFCVYIILFIFLPRKLEALGTKSVQKTKVSKMKKLRQRINNGETEVLKPDGNLENR